MILYEKILTEWVKNCYVLCHFSIPNYVYYHCRSRSRRSRSRTALRLRPNDAAPCGSGFATLLVNTEGDETPQCREWKARLCQNLSLKLLMPVLRERIYCTVQCFALNCSFPGNSKNSTTAILTAVPTHHWCKLS
jgi:hypothetical protein